MEVEARGPLLSSVNSVLLNYTLRAACSDEGSGSGSDKAEVVKQGVLEVPVRHTWSLAVRKLGPPHSTGNFQWDNKDKEKLKMLTYKYNVENVGPSRNKESKILVFIPERRDLLTVDKVQLANEVGCVYTITEEG